MADILYYSAYIPNINSEVYSKHRSLGRLSLILVLICSNANLLGSTHMHALTPFNSSLTHTQPTSFGYKWFWPSRQWKPINKNLGEWGYPLKDNLQDQTWPLRNATTSCSRAPTHTYIRSLSLPLNFCLASLSALTTDGVLIKSSRNITVSKQCSACQFHNCWVLIQPLTCSIQIGREPTVLAPTGSSLLARSCGVLQQLASLRKVNCGSCHASWHRV